MVGSCSGMNQQGTGTGNKAWRVRFTSSVVIQRTHASAGRQPARPDVFGASDRQQLRAIG
jgi:hypothetical protein